MALCTLHQKLRAPQYLSETSPGSGIFVCTQGNECKGGGASADPTTGGASSDSTVTCALHGKSRRANMCTQVLTEAGLQWQCTESTLCKGAGIPSSAASTLAALRYNPYGARPVVVSWPTAAA
eukprot:RCo005000